MRPGLRTEADKMANKAIRFPSMHVAQSTANRIQNIAAGIEPAEPIITPLPTLPDVPAESDALNAQLLTPPAPTELPAGADGAVVGAALEGSSLAGAAVSPLLGT
jgi:hypothetical protein